MQSLIRQVGVGSKTTDFNSAKRWSFFKRHKNKAHSGKAEWERRHAEGSERSVLSPGPSETTPAFPVGALEAAGLVPEAAGAQSSGHAAASILASGSPRLAVSHNLLPDFCFDLLLPRKGSRVPSVYPPRSEVSAWSAGALGVSHLTRLAPGRLPTTVTLRY